MNSERASGELFSVLFMSSIPLLCIWGLFMGAPVYPEDKIITVASVEYQSPVANEFGGRYTEMKIVDDNGVHYEYRLDKHRDNLMYAQINNGWNFPHDQMVEAGGKYRITLWHSVYMGSYVTDGFSNWNPNPEISKIVRLD